MTKQKRPIEAYEAYLKRNGFLSAPEWLLENWALKPENDLTFLLMEEIKWAITHNANIICTIFGTPGTGKSISGQKLASIIKKAFKKYLNLEIKIFLTWSFDETVNRTADLKRGDGILQDESEDISGEDANTINKQLRNIQRTVRQDQNWFIIIGPDVSVGKYLVHFSLETEDWDDETGDNTLILYGPKTRKPIGHVVLPGNIRIDKELLNQYPSEKKAFVKEVKKRRGFAFVKVDPKKLQEDVDRLLKIASKDLNMTKGELKAIARREIIGSISYVKHVTETVWAEILKMRRLQKEEEEEQLKQQQLNLIEQLVPQCIEIFNFSDKELKIGAIKQWFRDHGVDRKYLTLAVEKAQLYWYMQREKEETIPIHVSNEIDLDEITLVKESEQDDYDFFKLIVKELRKYSDPLSVEFFERWANGEDQRSIGQYYNVSQAMVSQRIKKLREDGLGYAGEDAFFIRLKEQFGEDVIKGGSNTDEPDFIIPSRKLVISFKTYHDVKWNVSTAAKKIGKKELSFLREGYTPEINNI